MGKKKDTLKILIGGAMYGVKNVGDEAVLFSIVNSLQKYSKNNIEIIVMTDDDKELCKKFKNIKSIPLNIPFFDFIKQIITIDFFICGGGTILSQCPIYSLQKVILARLFKTPTIIFGVGMNKINGIMNRLFILVGTNIVYSITTRDYYTLKNLMKYGCYQQIISTADPAILTKENETKKINRILYEIKKRNNENRKIISFTISYEQAYKEFLKEEEIQSLKKFIDYLIENSYFVIFLPSNFRKNNEISLMKLIFNNLLEEYKNYVFIIENELLPGEVIYLLKNFYIVISSRLHILIFSSLAETPFIGITCGEKVDNYLRLFKKTAGTDIKNIQYQNLIKKFIETNNNILYFKNEITKVKNEITKKAEFGEKILFYCLSKINKKQRIKLNIKFLYNLFKILNILIIKHISNYFRKKN